MTSKLTFALTTMAAVGIGILPVTAMEVPTPKLLASENYAADAVKENVVLSERKCIKISPEFTWCINF